MKYNDLDIISTGESGKNIYTEFTWNLIDICNYKCTYCQAGYGHDSTRPVSKFFRDTNKRNIWKQVIKRLSVLQNIDFEVTLVGGEPTLHPDILDILTSLKSVDNCKEIDLITNLSKQYDFFSNIADLNICKLQLIPSIHFEYFNNNITDKIISLSNNTNINIIPAVMLHDNMKFWNVMEKFLQELNQNNIKYSTTFIEDTVNYSANYTSEFFKRFDRYINNQDMIDKFHITTEDHTNHIVSTKDIHEKQIKMFKGWKCNQKSWLIDYDGNIKNSCTEELLNILGTNTKQQITCPKEICDCNAWWYYEKQKI